MSKIYEIHPGWMSKSEIAYKLGVSERTIYARWKRGELLRKEIQGQVLWTELPKEGRKEAEEGPSSARFHAHSEGFGSRGSWSSESQTNQDSLRELTRVLKQKRDTIALLEKENVKLQLSVVKVEEAVVYLSEENKKLLIQNEMLLRALTSRSIFQKLLLLIKSFWSS